MSEREMRFIVILKRWVIGLASTALISIVGGLLIMWQTGIVNATQNKASEKTLDELKKTVNEKASVSMVLTVKNDLEKEINTNYAAIKGQLDVVISMLPMVQNNSYVYKNKTK